MMYAIYGCGGHARSIADVLIFNGERSFIFIDENARSNELIFGREVYKNLSPIAEIESSILAIGDNRKRREFFYNHRDIKYKSIVSKDAYLGENSKIGEGVFVAHKAHVGPCVSIGNHSIINTGAIIEHECNIGDFCHIAPSVVISGRTEIGNNVFVGVGATIKDAVKICHDVTIGAGAVVIDDIKDPGVYIGVPIRKLR